VRVSPEEVSVASVPEFKEIHRAGSPFAKSAWYEKFTQKSTLGMFAIRDSKVHGQRRKMFARPFSKTELRRNWENSVRDKVRLAVSRIRDEAAASEKKTAMFISGGPFWRRTWLRM
jgi:hypothetical protein